MPWSAGLVSSVAGHRRNVARVDGADPGLTCHAAQPTLVGHELRRTGFRGHRPARPKAAAEASAPQQPELEPAQGADSRLNRLVHLSLLLSLRQGPVVDQRLVQTERMLHLRIWSPTAMREAVVGALSDDPAVSSLAVLPGVSLRPAGDVVLADVAREAANDVVDRLRALELHHEGSLDIDQVRAWLSQRGLDAERAAPGSSADSVVWVDVTHQAYADSEFNWTYVSFMTMATLIAGIAIILDSQVLVIGAMVLGPEFGAVAALGVALVRRRPTLLARAARTLVMGFVIAILATTLAALVARALGWVTLEDVAGPRPDTAFIYTPDKWSFIVAVIAAAAGVLSLTSARVGGLSGVFISVTTVPAAGNVALGLAFGVSEEIVGSSLQLLINLTGMALAGWAALAVQRAIWSRVSTQRARLAGRLRMKRPSS